MIQPANRVTEIQEYYFSRKLKEVAKLNAEGKDIISLAIGSPTHTDISLRWAYQSCAKQWLVSISAGMM